ncbi:MAG: FtsX-like permease family protein [Balneolales bacterium]
MSTLLKISWRNIWRSPGRSGVLLAATVAGLWAGVFTAAITNGFLEQRFERLIETEISHMQIHHPEYLIEREPHMTISQAGEIIEQLRQNENICAFTPRTLVDGMIQSPVTTSGVQIRGIDPDREEQTTNIRRMIVEGEYLDTDTRNPLLIGRKLAEKLNVDIGMRVVLTFQDTENELISSSFNIVGLFKAISTAEEESKVFTPASVLSEYLADEPVYHELAILMQDEAMSDSLAAELKRDFPHLETLTWEEISPELRYLEEVGSVSSYVFLIIILLALAFGILNTMLMAIFERSRELGMLMAIGMNKTKVFTMITLESVMLTLTGAVVGIILALATISYLGDEGLNLEAVGGAALEEVGYDTVVFPILETGSVLMITLLVIITALLSAVYPAIKALRLKPAEAVRDQM